MGIFDKFKKTAADVVDKHGDKVSEGVDKAGDLLDKKTGGKYTEHINTGEEKAKGAIDSLDGKNDDIPDESQPKTDVRDSNPNAGGPGGLEGDMGTSSERTGTDSAGDSVERTGTVGSSTDSTDGTTTYSDAEPTGPEMDETQNPAEVPSHESDPKSNPGTSSQGAT